MNYFFINTCQEHTINYRFVNSWGAGVGPLAVSQTYFSMKESEPVSEKGKSGNLSLLLSNKPVPPGSRVGFKFETLHGKSLVKDLPDPPLTNNLQPRKWGLWHLWLWRLDLGKERHSLSRNPHQKEHLWGRSPWRRGKTNIYKISPGVYNLIRRIK